MEEVRYPTYHYYDVGIEHLAFEVDSREEVDASYKRCVAYGAQIHFPPCGRQPGHCAAWAWVGRCQCRQMNALHRIGLIVPSSNTTMETEVPALLRRRERETAQDRFAVHSARVRMQHVTPAQLRAMNTQTERATTELADMRPDAVATACLVAIMAQGPGHHRAMEADIEAMLERENAPAPVVSSAGALIEALHALGARRIAIVTPYLKELTRLVAGYIEDAGIEVGDAVSLEVSDNRAVAALDPGDLKTHWRRLDLRDCDALVISACVQMPSLSVIEAVEARSGLPTLSAATATTWAILRGLGLEPSVPGAGALLATPERVA